MGAPGRIADKQAIYIITIYLSFAGAHPGGGAI